MIHRMPWSGLSVGSPAIDSEGWAQLADTDLRIVVGVTGVGKTTTLEELSERVPIRVLPDRRSLADEVILPAAQAMAGEPLAAVRDRVERFRLTARYRQQHPGGVAEALATLWLRESVEEILFFDGLRGEDECRWAAAHLPRASFVVLDAPTAVRLGRLVGRRSDFDRALRSTSAAPAGSFFDLVPGLEAVVSPEEASAVLALAEAAGSSLQDVAEKAAILVAEARNYDPKAAISTLAETLPAAQLLVVDTSVEEPARVAERIAAWALGS